MLENQQVFLSDVTDRSEKIHRQFLLTETKGPEQPHVETFKPQEKIKSDAQKQVEENAVKGVKRESNLSKHKRIFSQVNKREKVVDSKKVKPQNDKDEERIYQKKITKTKENVASKPLQKPQEPFQGGEKNRMQNDQSKRKPSESQKAKVDGPKLRHITMEEALRRFQYKASSECVNKCPQATDDDSDLSYSSMCNFTAQARWTNALQQNGAEVMPFVDDDVYVYPYERKYLSYPKLPDSSYLPSARKSRVVLTAGVMRGKTSTATCRLGGSATARLDLVDEAGRPRTLGGDEVRAWVGATHDHNGKQIDAMYPRAMASVVDLNNGSYMINVSCLWAGRSRLVVNLRYPREFMMMVVRTVRSGLSRFLGARFEKGGIVEEVPCLATPNIPGRPCICNLTSLNGGGQFYCARPLDTRLSCNDWTVSGTMTKVTPADMPNAEGKYTMKSRERIVPTDNIVIVTETNAVSGNQEPLDNAKPDNKERQLGNTSQEISGQTQLFIHSPLEPCSKTSRKVSWTTQRPTGYWRDADKTWVSLLCREATVTQTWMRACLKDSSVWIIGDSNGVRLYYKVAQSANLDHLDYGAMPFFDVMTRSKKTDNIKVHFTPHEHPLYVSKAWKQLDVDYIGVPDKIDAIPSKGRQFLVIHYFLHVTTVHLGLARARFESARDAIVRLLARNPQAYVAIRGPHTVSLNHYYDIAIGGDSLARHLVEIIAEVFEDLQDRVIFLDGWETSLTVGSSGIHPDGSVPEEVSRRFFSFICDENAGDTDENN